MTDRELLEFAAKAAGIDGRWDPFRSNFRVFLDGGIFLGDEWNPFTDDGDALRLAVKLEIQSGYCEFSGEGVAHWNRGNNTVREYGPDDRYAATRRAIVLAAAAIGKEMP